MRWSKTCSGRYYAKGERYAYVVRKLGAEWGLAMYLHADLSDAAAWSPWLTYGSRHDTKELAVAVADSHEALGEPYRPSEHGHRSRLTAAIRLAYYPAEKDR